MIRNTVLLIFRYVSIEGEDNDKRMPIGKCTVIGSSMMAGGDGVEKKTLYPCRLNSGLNLDSGSCQVRFTRRAFFLVAQVPTRVIKSVLGRTSNLRCKKVFRELITDPFHRSFLRVLMLRVLSSMKLPLFANSHYSTGRI